VALARRLSVPLETLTQLLEAFEKASIVVAVSGGSDAYVPARDPASVTVSEVLEAARSAGESHQFSYDNITSVPAVDEICGAIDGAIDAALGQRTMRDLALATPPVGNDGAVSAQAATGLAAVVSAEQLEASTAKRVDGDDVDESAAIEKRQV
jgi:DNA-binding IscR family transcriptional regulator